MAHGTVKKPYATYDWYADQYGGKVISEEDFPKYARQATEIIDAMTYGNITSNDLVVDCVRDATCAVAELACNYSKSTIEAEAGRGMKSESNDGYSVTYDDTMSTAEGFQGECRSVVRIYLANTGLLFRGTKIPRRCRK